jgi:hypothetical protein
VIHFSTTLMHDEGKSSTCLRQSKNLLIKSEKDETTSCIYIIKPFIVLARKEKRDETARRENMEGGGRLNDCRLCDETIKRFLSHPVSKYCW